MKEYDELMRELAQPPTKRASADNLINYAMLRVQGRAKAEGLKEGHEAAKAEIARLHGVIESLQDMATAEIEAASGEQIIARQVADYGSAEAAVKATHDLQLRLHRTVIDHYRARTEAAETMVAEMVDVFWGEGDGAPKNPPDIIKRAKRLLRQRPKTEPVPLSEKE